MKHYFDTETTGFMRSVEVSRYQDQPWMLEYCGKLLDDSGLVVEKFCSLIKCDGLLKIPESAQNIHKIKLEECQDTGCSLNMALDAHFEMQRRATMQVGYYIKFDYDILEVACYRAVAEYSWLYPNIPQPQAVDLCDYATNLCCIPATEAMIKARRLGFKRASLIEAMKIICEMDHSNAHRAEPDVDACIALHRKIKEKMDAAKASHSQPS